MDKAMVRPLFPSQTIYLLRRGTIVTVDGGENCPQREINVVCALDVHGHAHGRGMSDERMRRVVCGHEDTSANGLFSQIII